MNFNRVNAMFLRYLINMRHNYDRLADMFYWPAMELFIWGLTGLYLAQLNSNSSQYLFVILNGLVFWIVIWRAQYEITTNLLAELWDRNIINIFSTPLKVREWIAAFMIFGLMKTIISLIFSAILAFIFYKYNIFAYGLYLIPFLASLLLTGWAGGFFVAAFLIRFGMKIQTIAWAGIVIIVPFSAIYYPLSILPDWVQIVGKFIPSTYIFEGLRELLFTGNLSIDKLLISFALNIFYLVLSIWFFVTMFRKSRNLGLGRLI